LKDREHFFHIDAAASALRKKQKIFLM